MALYFKDIEITNIDNLVPQSGLDITDIWFGETNVYTVWQIYEGTLPATIISNGDNLRQYQIWGNVGGVGDKTANLWDGTYSVLNKYLNESGSEVSSNDWRISKYIPISDENYTLDNIMGGAPCACFYDVNYDFISSVRYYATTKKDVLLQAPSNAGFIRISAPRIGIYTDSDKISLTEGTTPPKTFVPFGYEVDMVSRSRNLFDENSEKVSGFINVSGQIVQAGNPIWTYDYFQIIGETKYTYISYDVKSVDYYTIRVAWYDENKTFISRTLAVNAADVARTVTAPSTAAYARLSIDVGVYDVMFNSGSTALPYEPYDYTTTPIYIGDEPLDKDEYVDYQAGKMFRRTENEFDYKKYFETCTAFNLYFGYAPIQLKPNTQYTVYTNCLSGTSGSHAQNVETSVIICPAEVAFSTANGGVYGSTPFTFTTQASGLCYIGIRTEHGTYASCTEIYEESDFADGTAYVNVVEGVLVSETFIPYLQPTDPPVPLPALPTCEGTTIVNYEEQSVAPEKVLLKYRKEKF